MERRQVQVRQVKQISQVERRRGSAFGPYSLGADLVLTAAARTE